MKTQPITTSNSPFSSGYFITDGGLETTLIFHQGLTLNHFSAFELLTTADGMQKLKDYYAPYLKIAGRLGVNFILETPTWRASSDWGAKLGYSTEKLDRVNREAVRLMREIRHSIPGGERNIYISGCIGPRGDGYVIKDAMSPGEAMEYHSPQVRTFALADVDIVTAMTINYSDEAIGIVQAAKAAYTPVAISFTVETNGFLPSGESLKEAIEKVDKATVGYAEHFMINCAHPRHFSQELEGDGHWKYRIRGIRANASTKSHAELDEAESLDTGDKGLLASGYADLKKLLPEFRIIGGCCGTDHTHVDEVCQHIVV